MLYRIIVENSNKTTSFVGSEWTDSQDKLIKDLLYFSGQGFFCKVEQGILCTIESVDNSQFSAEVQREVRKLAETWSQKLAKMKSESSKSGTYQMARRECLEELRAIITKQK